MKKALVIVALLLAGGCAFAVGAVVGSYVVPPTGVARMGDRP